tara:strand:+ start:108 stop:1703 length:1596 start_codon:yes stop_codon:yes gene_type:complete
MKLLNLSVIFTFTIIRAFNPFKQIENFKSNSLKKIQRENLRRISKSKISIPPEELDEKRIKNMNNIGYFWNEIDRIWERKPKPKPEKQIPKVEEYDFYIDNSTIDYGMTKVEEKRYEQLKHNIFKPAIITNETVGQTEIQSNLESIERLGFRFDITKQKWYRTKARDSPITINITHPKKQQILAVTVKTEPQIQACNKLEYILTRTSIDEPENIVDFFFRIVRIDYFVIVWLFSQLKFLEKLCDSEENIFSESQMYFWSNHLTSEIIVIYIIFMTSHLLERQYWMNSNGPVHVNGIEKAIADSIVGKKIYAPRSWEWREKIGGISWKLVFSILSIISVLPRLQLVHSYIQNKLENFIIQHSSLDTIIDNSHYLSAAIFSIIGVGFLASLCEFIAFNWSRKPKDIRFEKKAILDALKEDTLGGREKTEAIEAFETISTQWCNTFYDNSLDIKYLENEYVVSLITFIKTSSTASLFYISDDGYNYALIAYIIAIIVDFIYYPKIDSKFKSFNLLNHDSLSNSGISPFGLRDKP